MQPWLEKQSRLTLARLKPRLEPLLANRPDRQVFEERLEAHFPDIFRLLHALYGTQYDFFYHLEQILATAAEMYIARPRDLKMFDRLREENPLWFQSQEMLGGVCYVDQFAGTLAGLREKIPYFKELGLTYLHLMPLFRCPPEQNDGGYAVSSFREVNPALGTMEELASLTAELRQNGISLVLDFVFNHTSDEHDWALRALEGDADFQAYYRMFDDRTLPDQYEVNLREIFPVQAPGSFTYRPEIKKWVWTTFNRFQWDLNYANPAVFCAVLREMFFLANQGVEFLRLDAVPFIWKEMGTNCENLPEAHIIIQGFNALARVVAPALLFKSEAIVHPRDVASYVSWQECQISYNPLLMVCLWEALATREVRLLNRSMVGRFAIAKEAAWINYVRSHDDIGWGFANEDAAQLGLNGFDHRHFLNLFYIGRFPGSFSTGLPFNYNTRTQDMRISGATASLAGLEAALNSGDETDIENAIQRILLLHAIILSIGGIPLIYLGDAIATINDYSYEEDEGKADDNRWVHRPQMDWERAAKRNDPSSIEGRVFQPLSHLIAVRKQTPALANGKTVFFDTGNPHVFGFVRNDTVLVLGNFSEQPQPVERKSLAQEWAAPKSAVDLTTGQRQSLKGTLVLAPYQVMWLTMP